MHGAMSGYGWSNGVRRLGLQWWMERWGWVGDHEREWMARVWRGAGWLVGQTRLAKYGVEREREREIGSKIGSKEWEMGSVGVLNMGQWKAREVVA